MHLTLLGLPPTTNSLYSVVGRRHVLSEEGQRYHHQIRTVLEEISWNEPDDAPYAVSITYYLGAYERDVDGSHKALIDALSGHVWIDDRQIHIFCLRKRRVGPGMLPYVNIVIRRLAEKPASMRRLPSPPARGDDDVLLVSNIIPPTTNNLYFASESRVKTPQAILAGRLLARAIEAARRASGRDQPWAGPVAGRIRYYFAAERRDVDGSHKLLLDAAKGRLWGDDNQLVHICLAKGLAGRDHYPTIIARFWPLPRRTTLAEPPLSRRRAAGQPTKRARVPTNRLAAALAKLNDEAPDEHQR